MAFRAVPDEIIRIIFSFVPPGDYLSLSSTCKRFSSFVDINLYWKHRCLERLATFINVPEILVKFLERDPTNWKKMIRCMQRRKGETLQMKRASKLQRATIFGCFEKKPFRIEKMLPNDFNFACSDEEIFIGDIAFKGVGVGTSKTMDYDYNGSFYQYRKNGRGVLKYHNSITYEGYFMQGMFNGVGTMTWPDGLVYNGHWAWNDPLDLNFWDPEIKACISDKVCTRRVTNKKKATPQRMRHFLNRYMLCAHCTVECSNGLEPYGRLEFFPYGHCQCKKCPD